MYQVLIVDDQKSSRELMRYLLLEDSNYQVVGLLDEASKAQEFCEKQRVDIILMDIYTGKKEQGLEVSRLIKASFPNIKIIIVTFLVESLHIEQAKKFGLEGFWYKDHSKESLLEIMKRVLEGEKVFPSEAPKVMVGLAKATEFTKQELKIVKSIVNGYSYQEICERLEISRSTLNFHIANIKSKTGYDNILKVAVDVAMQKFIIADGYDGS